jgi:hypothetical protein
MSGTFGQLLAWRWVTGIGSALQMAGAQLFLTDISLSTNRARTLGTNQARCLRPSFLISDCLSICCDHVSYSLQLLTLLLKSKPQLVSVIDLPELFKGSELTLWM